MIAASFLRRFALWLGTLTPGSRLCERLAHFDRCDAASLPRIGVPEAFGGEAVEPGEHALLDIEQIRFIDGPGGDGSRREQPICLMHGGKAQPERIGVSGRDHSQHGDISSEVAAAEDFIRKMQRAGSDNDLSTLMLRAASERASIPFRALDIWSRRHELRPDLYRHSDPAKPKSIEVLP